jgi:hypothetical protein
MKIRERFVCLFVCARARASVLLVVVNRLKAFTSSSFSLFSSSSSSSSSVSRAIKKASSRGRKCSSLFFFSNPLSLSLEREREEQRIQHIFASRFPPFFERRRESKRGGERAMSSVDDAMMDEDEEIGQVRDV